ncbi:MAG TPA: efflux RND transporter permease subunit [Candidatus Sumerlaeota bacterium]|nr:efflux RND transporter permease subunit [Candidatus Sumerlaeota bacterium]
MILIDASLRNSTAVVVGMILTILFGYLAFIRIPIQLNPTIERPFITVETIYPGASATEVEQEITIPQEEQLASVENLLRIRSTSREGSAQIILEFEWGVNKDLAALDVNKKLQLVEDLPEDAEEPQILTVNREEEETVNWLYVEVAPQVELTVNQLRQLVDDLILPRLERVEDVGGVRRYGGAEREIHVLVDLDALAARDLSLNEIAAALRQENRNLRGGDIDQGANRLIVRTLGQYSSLGQIGETVIKTGPAGPIRIRDVARVADNYKDQDVVVRIDGSPSIAIGVVKKTGANTLEVAERVKAELKVLNESLAPRGLQIRVAYDASDYIWDSIYQVRDNLIVGAILATVILWFFLRSVASTFIVGLTIPVCMVGTFVLLAAFGRSVNIVSLAGLAFASGMIVDNGIVVIENIYRHRIELHKSILRASRDGAVEVWAPIVASTLTTLAVFIPILFIEEEAGQLFRDIAFSISFAVGLSMFAAITMVPMLASRMLRLPVGERPELKADRWWKIPAVAVHKVVDPILDRIARATSALFLGIVRLGLRSLAVSLAIIAILVVLFLFSLRLTPEAEYLPTGNQNFVLGIFKFPPGLSLTGAEQLMLPIERQVLALPELERTFFVILRDGPIFGAIIEKAQATKDNIQRIVGQLNGFAATQYPFPDVIPIIFQVPVFGGGQTGKSITVDIRGPQLRRLEELTNQITGQLRAIDGVEQVRPSLDLDNPELQVYPDRERLADLGLTSSDLAETVEALVEGRITSLYREGGKEYDLKLKAADEEIRSPEDLRAATLALPGGAKVKLADVARVNRGLGPVTIEHLEQDRSVTITVNVAEDAPLEHVVNAVQQRIIDPLLPTLPYEYNIELSGSADDLARTMQAMTGSFLLALLIIYLLMAALFRSFFYPLIIMFSIPLAMTGALLGIWLLDEQMNVITMLGYILLAGVVVNNAILLVDVTLSEVREGRGHAEAIEEAVRRRMRPIFMTSVTSVLGMTPLALGQGAGAELYSGLGVAVVGGLILSTLFTLILIPLLMKIFLGLRDGFARRVGREDWTEYASARALAELDEQI